MNKSMFKIFIINFFVLTVVFISCSKKDFNSSSSIDSFSVNQTGSDLPYIKITTQNLILNEPKVMANMEIFEKGEKTFSSPIGIEYRGASSFRMSNKKSYGVETWDESGNDINLEIFDFPKEEDWILMGHVFRSPETIFDPSLMRHYIGYELYRNMGNYSSRSKFVELEIGDNTGAANYQGVYVFMEKLKRDSNRINIAKLKIDDNDTESITGGYILKIDKTSGSDVALENQSLEYYESNWQDDASYNEDISFRSNYDINGDSLQSLDPFGPPYHPFQYLETYFLYEYPKADEISLDQKAYIQNYINDFETALANENFSSDHREYLNYIDIDSFVDFFIINELTGNIDGYRLSTYLHKDRGEKLKMGPIWDFDVAFGNININENWLTSGWHMKKNSRWIKMMFRDEIFIKKVKERFNYFYGNKDRILNFSNELSKKLHKSRYENDKVWKTLGYYYFPQYAYDFSSFKEEHQYLNNWITERFEWLKSEIKNL